MQSNQQFTSLDTLSVFALIGLSIALVSGIVINATSDQKLNSARIQAERIAVQMVFGKFLDSNSPDRSPASFASRNIGIDGKISVDPWGNPFSYSVLRDVSGKTVAIIVSSGPDGKRDTEVGSERGIIINDSNELIGATAIGDDVIYAQRSNQ